MYEAVAEGLCWEVAVVESSMGARPKYLCLVAALDFTRSGRVDLDAKENWIMRLSARSGLSPKDTEKAIEEAKKAGFLTVVRHRAGDGEYSVYSIRQSRPRQDGYGDMQAFVVRSKETMIEDVKKAMRTDTAERGLQVAMGWE